MESLEKLRIVADVKESNPVSVTTGDDYVAWQQKHTILKSPTKFFFARIISKKVDDTTTFQGLN